MNNNINIFCIKENLYFYFTQKIPLCENVEQKHNFFHIRVVCFVIFHLIYYIVQFC